MARKQPVRRSSRNAKRGNAPRVTDSARSREIAGILGLAASIFVVAGLLSLQLGDGNLMGPFGRSIAVVFYAVFGIPAHLAAAALALVSLRLLTDRHPISTPRHAVGISLGIAALATLLHLIAPEDRIAGYAPGGLIGETTAEVFRAVISTAGTALLASVALIVAVVITTPLRMRDVLSTIGRGIARGARRSVQLLWGWTREAGRFVGEVVRAVLPERDRDDYLSDEDTTIMSEFDEPAFVIPGTSAQDEDEDEEDDEEDDEEGDSVSTRDEPAVIVGQVEETTAKMSAATLVQLVADAEVAASQKKTRPRAKNKRSNTLPGVGGDGQGPGGEEPMSDDTIVDLVDIIKSDEKQPVIVESKFKATAVEDMKRKEKDVDAQRGYIPLGDGEYKLPPVHLLEYDEAQAAGMDTADMLELSARLVQTLEHYKVKGEVTAIRPGPVVTMYEFAPAPGTRLSRIESLSDELAMNLEAERVRIVAPIPGKAVVGIEVPNHSRETVYLKEILADDAFQKGKARLPLALGKTIEGAPTVLDLAKMPHLLVAGTTGSGKSVSINSMITSLLYNSTPEDVRMIMVDPKMLELSIYEGIPHLLLPVVTDPKKANLALRWAVEEMENRYQKLSEMRVRDIASYNKKLAKRRMEWEADRLRAAADEAERLAIDFEGEVTEEQQLDLPMEGVGAEPPKKLPYIVIVIDEFADLMMCAPKEVETSVARIAQKARAAGIHLILATQRPSVNVITGLIKANFPSRVAFRVAQKVDSRTILDQGGAEALLGSGDMLFSDRGANPCRLHGCFVGDDEIGRIVDFLKEQGKPVYNLEILKPRDEEGEDGEDGDEQPDDKYDLAVSIVAETQRVSISYLQRRLGIGYNRAAKIVERMERNEVVGPPDSRNVREVLVSAA